MKMSMAETQLSGDQQLHTPSLARLLYMENATQTERGLFRGQDKGMMGREASYIKDARICAL